MSILTNIKYRFSDKGKYVQPIKGELAEYIFKEFNQRKKEFYDDNPILDELRFENNVLTGDGGLSAIIVDKILTRKTGYRVANPVDIAKELKYGNKYFLRKYSVPLALVVRDSKNIPDFHEEKALVQSIRDSSKYTEGSESPFYIAISGLDLENAPHARNFRVLLKNNNTEPQVYTPALNKDGVFLPKDINEHTGLPNAAKLQDTRSLRYNKILKMMDNHCQLSSYGVSFLNLVSGRVFHSFSFTYNPCESRYHSRGRIMIARKESKLGP